MLVGAISAVSAADVNSSDVSIADEEVISQDVSDVDLIGDNKSASSVVFSNEISYEVGQSGSSEVNITGGTIEPSNVNVDNHSEAKIVFMSNTITVSGLSAGDYTLRVITTPDENHTAVEATNGITVSKIAANIQVSKLTAAYKKSTSWTIKLVDSKGNAVADTIISLKIFTGSKYKIATVRTNDEGVATYKTSSLSVGNHKIVLSVSNENYTVDSVTSYVNIVKQTPLKIMVLKRTTKQGAYLTIKVMNKNTKKYVNGVKLKLLIYTGSKYKSINLKTKKVSKFKGVTGYATNALTVGYHKVKIMPSDIKYSGSATSSMTIKKSAKKYPTWTTKV